MSSKKRQPNNKEHSMSRQEESGEEIVRSIKKQLSGCKTNDLLQRAKPVRLDRLTGPERKAHEKEKTEVDRLLLREQELLPVKRRLQSIIHEKCADPNSELCTKAKEILEFVVKFESSPELVSDHEWRRVFTILLPELEALQKAEAEKEIEPVKETAETKPDIAPTKRPGAWTCIKKIPSWIYVLVLFLAALFTIFQYLGLLEPINEFIEGKLYLK